MNMEEVYNNTIDRLNKIYKYKYNGSISYIDFNDEMQMILLGFSNNIKKFIYEQISEDIQEKQLLKIESELE
jgi:hypothetical protein